MHSLLPPPGGGREGEGGTPAALLGRSAILLHRSAPTPPSPGGGGSKKGDPARGLHDTLHATPVSHVTSTRLTGLPLKAARGCRAYHHLKT